MNYTITNITQNKDTLTTTTTYVLDNGTTVTGVIRTHPRPISVQSVLTNIQREFLNNRSEAQAETNAGDIFNTINTTMIGAVQTV